MKSQTQTVRHGVSQRVAANVRAEMARQRIPQVALADALGITQQSVSARLRGAVDFSVPELDLVARLLNVSAALLLGSEPARSAS